MNEGKFPAGKSQNSFIPYDVKRELGLPTFKEKDMKRISAHLNMTVQEFKDKWLYKQRGTGDWLNKSTPCQFLDLDTNMCSIYEVRPADCAGFPHFSKKKMVYYMHTHKQNLEYCPATYRMVERMMEKLKRPPVADWFYILLDKHILDQKRLTRSYWNFPLSCSKEKPWWNGRS